MARRPNVFTRMRAGLYAKKAGDWFETWLETACKRHGWAIVKIPSGCRWVANGKAIPVKTPFDFVFAKNGVSIFGDAKTTKAVNWSFSETDPWQLENLLKLEKTGNISGYIVNFREQSKTVFFSSKQLSGLKPRCSLSPDDGILIGNNQEINLEAVTNGGLFEKA